MKHFLKSLFATLAVALIVVLPSATSAQTTADTSKSEEEANYTVAGMYFRAANVLTLDEATDKDLYAAGSTLTIGNEINGDVFAAGQDLTIDGVVKGDVRVAGSVVTINGTVEGNVLVAGSTVKITKDAKINGYLNAYGATVVFDGTVEKDAHIGGADVALNGVFNGEVSIESEKVTVGKDATIVKTVAVTGPNAPVVNNDALKDKVTFTEKDLQMERQESWQDELMGTIQSLLYWFVASALIAAVVLQLLHRPVMRSVETLEAKAWNSIGVGFALLICVPVAGVLLMITIIGIPLALFLLALYIFALCLSTIPASLWLGQKLLPSQSDGNFRGVFFQYLAGNLIIMILAATPFIGWLVSLFVMVAGLGAYGLVMMNKSAHKKA